MNIQNLTPHLSIQPLNPRNGAYIQFKTYKFVTLYNAMLDTFGIYKVYKDWSNSYWTPPDSYIYPTIDWEKIWKEMDYCNHGYLRVYNYSESINGPEIDFTASKL